VVDPQLVLTLETIAAHAWPAAEVEGCHGWQLRYTGGITRRANSVWPNGDTGDVRVEAKLVRAESFYAERNLPTLFQICAVMQPADLDVRLAACGYIADAYTHVQTTALATMLTQLPALCRHSAFEVEVNERFDPLWFDLYCESEAVSGHAAAMRRAILQRIAPPTGYAVLRVAGEPAAVGLGVVEAGWLGIYCMATQPAFRRRGAASTILHTLALWAQHYGARNAYLQVMQHNGAAQALYTHAGFVTAYDYHYRIKPLADSRAVQRDTR